MYFFTVFSLLTVDRELIQVSFELNDQNIDREIRGLERASGEIDANRFLILTMDQEREIFRIMSFIS